VNTVVEHKTFLFDNGNPINFDMNCFPRSQDLKPIYEYTSGVAIADSDYVVKSHGWFMLKNHHFVNVSKIEAIDIDYEDDFQLAEILYRRKIENEGIDKTGVL
jgi:CMP-N-acetylneuraminic acid synthetase